MLCNECNDDIFDGDEIKCSTCITLLHFGCASLRETSFRKMSKNAKLNWICNKCKFSVLKDKTPTSVSATVLNSMDSCTLSNETFKSLIESVNYMSDKFDSFGKQLQEMITTIKFMKEENQILREQNNKLKNEVTHLDRRINVLEQKSIENFAEIVGVPETNNENCIKTVEAIAASVGVETTILKAYRIQSKFQNKPRKMIVEFQTNQTKRTLMENVRKTKLTGETVNANWNNDKIYINDCLTLFNRNLFFKAKVFAREKSFKFVWFKDLKLFIKKSESTKAIIIDNEDALSKLI